MSSLFNNEKLKEILLNECNFYNHQAEKEIEGLKKLQEPLQIALQQWIEDRTISEEIEVAGVKLKDIIEKRKCNFTSALFLMSVFMDEHKYVEDFKSIPVFFKRDTGKR
ncbi:hypothetical protein [Hazenella coriacea]|uniref:Uncharacterized protein n=1 Tax=Hazenella coriacea TaxID=1179467 RepID=A0A4R3LGI7_9BACL|nr:hypothetical protein [Hazenella coriacea]TCS96626.1 hypothetical protein EDD58_101262 [Hazenella coriacea]